MTDDLFRRVTDELRADGPACVHLEALPRFLADPQTAAPRRAMPKVKGRVALIPVQGVMSRQGRYGVSTVGVIRALEAAADESEIAAVLMPFDTPGGSAYGTPELASAIERVKAAKPVVGLADAMAASAGQWALSACSRSVVAPSGDVGSIGAFILHATAKRMFADAGIDINIVRSVPGKADANPYEELTEEARSALQQSVEACHAEFVETVARNRGKSRAYAEENFGRGRLVGAKDALRVGLVDRIATVDEVLSEMLSKAGKGTARAQEAETAITAAFLGVDPAVVASDRLMRERRRQRASA